MQQSGQDSASWKYFMYICCAPGEKSWLSRTHQAHGEDDTFLQHLSYSTTARCRSPHPSRVRGSPHPFSKKGAGRAVFRKNQHWNGAGSDRAATVREAFPASAIGRLEERVGTGAFEACLQGQHCRSGVLPVVALLVSEGVASPQHQKLVRGGSPESRFKRDI